MIPDFKASLVPAPRTDNGVGCALACGPDGSQIVPAFKYALSPQGEYLREIRRALDVHLENAAKILKIGIADVSGLETGRFVFAESSTWARVELALIDAVAPAWCGENAGMRVNSAAHSVNALRNSRKTGPDWFDFHEAAEDVGDAAFKQIHTVKRGILYRLAGALALEAVTPGEAVKLALEGLDCASRIGPMPPWLNAGLQAVLVAARAEPAEARQ